MADVKLPNISQSNLNSGEQQQTYSDAQPPRNDNRSQSFHSGRGGGGTGGNGFGNVGRSIMEAKKQRKEYEIRSNSYIALREMHSCWQTESRC